MWFIAPILTIVVGIFAEILNHYFNSVSMGSICAIAVMGGFIIYVIEHHDKK